MKLGADKPWKVTLAVVLAVVSIIMLARTLISPPTQQAAAPVTPTTPAQQPRRRPSGTRAGRTVATANEATDPRLRLDLLKSSEDVDYAGVGRNIFRAEAEQEVARVVKQPVRPQPQPQPTPVYVPPQPPPPPPIALRFFGFANEPGQPKKVFLADGDNVFVAGEGEIVGRRYKVVRIGTNSVEIQDVLNNNTQTIPLTEG